MPAPGRTTLTISEPDEQRERAHDLEVQQRQSRRSADLLHVLHAGDAGHHRAEDDRRDDHLDQLDEAVAERLHGGAGLGSEPAEHHAERDGQQHLQVEPTVGRALLAGSGHAQMSPAFVGNAS